MHPWWAEGSKILKGLTGAKQQQQQKLHLKKYFKEYFKIYLYVMAVIYLLFTGIWEYLQINQKYTNLIFYLS